MDDVDEFPSSYQPSSHEGPIQDLWEEQNAFQADNKSQKPPFCIVIPPPNVTGVLHMGHALVNTLQDIVVRWKRMSGFETLWVPGTDHAGIATQTVIERHLFKTEGKRRQDFERSVFLEHLWKWKKEYERGILSQLKRLGCSCDWSRLRFTLDEQCSRAVRTAFKRLYDQGLIYRGHYLVNWDPVAQTALSDDEVEYEERSSSLWFIRYHLVDEPGFVVIATTRPETLLGDTAVAVNPSDPRYKHLIGKRLHLPLTERSIPIIGDNYVDPEFGTGALKITPAHDPNDYQIGLRHSLEQRSILTKEGTLNEHAGAFFGLTRENARVKIVEALKEQGLIEKIEPHTHRVGVSYRSKAVIEPLLSKQWFVKMESFKKDLRKLVEEGDVQLTPESWKNTYYHWIDNLRDWCISRQLWWGHRIPVWIHKHDPKRVICSEEELPKEVAENPHEWEQDPDVLDTWFSSALWPMSTLGWPDKTPDFEKFYPVNLLVTGHDILFFWVARMLFMGKELTGKAPFPQTFLHGLIFGKSYWRVDEQGHIQYVSQDERARYDKGESVPKDVKSKWEKLSKSKGNVINPLEMIDEYGTDALRMSLCASSPQGAQIDLDRRRFEEFKNFANKIWNGARFVFLNLEGLKIERLEQGIDRSLLTLEDRWILTRLNRSSEQMHLFLSNYQFDSAALFAYDFFWKELCAYYVEIAKPVLSGKSGTPALKQNKQVLLVVLLCHALRLLHPMAPFITEELFQKLKARFQGKSDELYCGETLLALSHQCCANAPYPRVISLEDLSSESEQEFSVAENLVRTIRNIRAEMHIPPQIPLTLYLSGSGIENYTSIIEALIKVEKIHVVEKAPELSLSATGIVEHFQVTVPLPKECAVKEQQRLEKLSIKLENSIAQTKQLLENPEFLEKAATQLVEQKQKSLKQAQEEIAVVQEKLKKLDATSI